MKVKLLFFGATADTVGKREAELWLDENSSADSALERIFAEFPILAQTHQKTSLLFSVNREYSSGDEIIKNGDELAIFTAVSGG